MVLSKQGQAPLVNVMLSVMFYLAIVAMVGGLQEAAATASTDLNCAGAGLSTGEEATCIITDSYLPIFIGVGLAVAVSFIGLRRYQESQGGG